SSFVDCNPSAVTVVAEYYDDPDEHPTTQLHRFGSNQIVETHLKRNASIIKSTYDRNSDGIDGRIILFGQHPEVKTWKYGSGQVIENALHTKYIYADSNGNPMEPTVNTRDIITESAKWAVEPLLNGNTNSPLNAPFNPYLSNGATDVSINPTLSWQCSDPDNDALIYDVYFGTSSNPPLKASGITSTTYNPGTLNYDTTYYWKVVANDGQVTTTGQTWHFTTKTESNPPPKPPGGDTPIAE
ncbi:MAG: hypothetical protein U9O96_02765, partial [Candidatus Thermoplasmatota archaeon]|nr:hypothetical protein [Candidatus Thermoplasmatota archaeon]